MEDKGVLDVQYFLREKFCALNYREERAHNVKGLRLRIYSLKSSVKPLEEMRYSSL